MPHLVYTSTSFVRSTTEGIGGERGSEGVGVGRVGCLLQCAHGLNGGSVKGKARPSK